MDNDRIQKTVTFHDLQLAIRRSSESNPAAAGGELPADTNRLAEILGQMIYRKLDAIPIHVLQGEHLEAFERWSRDDAD